MACYNGCKCFAVPLSKIHVDKKTLFKKLLSKSFVSGNKTKKIYSLLLGLYVLKDTCRLTKQEQLYSSLVYNCDKLYLFGTSTGSCLTIRVQSTFITDGSCFPFSRFVFFIINFLAMLGDNLCARLTSVLHYVQQAEKNAVQL